MTLEIVNNNLFLSFVLNYIKMSISEKMLFNFGSWIDDHVSYDGVYFTDNTPREYLISKIHLSEMSLLLSVRQIDDTYVCIDLRALFSLDNFSEKNSIVLNKVINLDEDLDFHNFLQKDIIDFCEDVTNYDIDIIKKKNIGVEFFMEYL